jgi:hypothetical protein
MASFGSGGLSDPPCRFVFFGSGPAAANTRQLKGLRSPGENLSRRDSVKVAQYEVLGGRSEIVTRPGRDDRLAACAREGVCERRGVKTFLSYLAGRAFLFASFPSTSYWAVSSGPFLLRPSGYGGQAGTDFHQRPTTRTILIATPYIDALGQPPDPVTLLALTGQKHCTGAICSTCFSTCSRHLFRADNDMATAVLGGAVPFASMKFVGRVKPGT